MHKTSETKNIFEKSTKLEIPLRFIAILGFCLTAAVITLELTKLLFSRQDKIISDFIVLGLFVLQFFLPTHYIVTFLTALIIAFFNIWGGGNLLGLLFFLFALSLAMKMGFFRTHIRIKIVSLTLIFFSVFLVQFTKTNGTEKFIISMVNIVIAIALIIGFLYIFHDNLKEFYTKKESLDIARYNFTKRQIACIKGCYEQKKLKTIADEEYISESAIKKEMLVIYSAFDVEDRHDLFHLLSQYTLKL